MLYDRDTERFTQRLECALEVPEMDVRSPLDLTNQVDEDRKRSHREQRPASEPSRQNVGDLSRLKILTACLVPAEDQGDPADGCEDETHVQWKPRRPSHRLSLTAARDIVAETAGTLSAT